MPPTVVDPSRVRAFTSADALDAWLSEHHARVPELWLMIYKKGSGVPSVNYAEALDVVLAWGWIDGIRKALDERAFLQRYTPRRPKSIWSQRNRDHIERLQRAGRMRPPGLAEVEAAKADGRWAAAYAPPSSAQIPQALLSAIEALPAARATFARLDAVNRFALAHRLERLKTDAGRERAIARYVEMLARGETLHPIAEGAGARQPKVRSAAQAATSATGKQPAQRRQTPSTAAEPPSNAPRRAKATTSAQGRRAGAKKAAARGGRAR